MLYLNERLILAHMVKRTRPARRLNELGLYAAAAARPSFAWSWAVIIGYSD